MRKLIIITILTVIGFGVSFRSEIACATGLVICCCETWNGGTCCAEVGYCDGGTMIPGCRCRWI